ncbi:MAG: hypothetical protein R3E02_04995 [Blastomonas sp.]
MKSASGKAVDYASDIKDRASDAIANLSKLIDETAAVIDENVGERYGDYARSASRSVNEAADRLRTKQIEDLGKDTREFVRKSPALAIGIATIASLVLAKAVSSVFSRKD